MLGLSALNFVILAVFAVCLAAVVLLFAAAALGAVVTGL